MAIILFDDFNRANSDSMGSDWTERGADFDIVSNAAELITPSDAACGAYEAKGLLQVDEGMLVGGMLPMGGGLD